MQLALKFPEHMCDVKQDPFAKLPSLSPLATFTSCISFVVSEIRKKQFQFKIGVTTIFLVVAFSTYLSALLANTAPLFFMIAQNSFGDFDVLFTASSIQSRPENGNFYLDS